MKDFIYYLFHYKKIIKELRVLRERKEENQLILANYIDKIKRLEEENCRLGKYNDELEKECNEIFKRKDEKVVVSIHVPTYYGEKIHEFTNYGNYKIHDEVDMSKTENNFWMEEDDD